MNKKSFAPGRFDPGIAWLAEKPIAHRGLHTPMEGIYENTLSAARAAIDSGFAIEMDLQPSLDGVPMVFHDYNLSRLTAHIGNIREYTHQELTAIRIADSDDFIPTLDMLLEAVNGNAGLVLELKGLGDSDPDFTNAVGKSLAAYHGRVAAMSFSHHLIEDLSGFRANFPVGLTAKGNDTLFEIHQAFIDRVEVDFLSYSLQEITCKFVREFRMLAKPVISWTVRSSQEAQFSDRHADQITFEGFIPVANESIDR
jgi:glycerophosphoryl diester phosphodiesterase